MKNDKRQMENLRLWIIDQMFHISFAICHFSFIRPDALPICKRRPVRHAADDPGAPQWRVTNDKWEMENLSSVDRRSDFPYIICHLPFFIYQAGCVTNLQAETSPPCSRRPRRAPMASDKMINGKWKIFRPWIIDQIFHISFAICHFSFIRPDAYQ